MIARIRIPAWTALAAVVAVVTGVYFVLPSGSAQAATNCAVGLSVATAIGLRAWRMQAAARLPWLAVAAAMAAFGIGDGLLPTAQGNGSGQLGFAPYSDIAYVTSYVFAVGGLVLLVRRRSSGREMGTVIDSLVAAAAGGMCLWVWVIAPEAYHHATSADEVMAMAYLVIDVLVLGLLLRLLLEDAAHLPALPLFAGGAAALLVGDILFAIARSELDYNTGNVRDVTWLLMYGLIGAAGLHPSAERIAVKVRPSDGRLSPGRRGMLLGAGVMPVLVLIFDFDGDTAAELPAVAVGGAVIAALLVARFSLYAASRERLAAGERALRYAAAELAGVGDRDSIGAAVLAGAMGLVPHANEIRVNLLDGREFVIVAAAGDSAGELEGFRSSFDKLAAPVQSALREHRSVDLPIGDSLRTLVSVHPDTHVLGLYPLLGDDEDLAGWLVVGTERPLTSDVRESVFLLASLASLALERAAFTVHDTEDHCEAWLAAVVQGANDVITIVEPDGTVRWQTDSIERALGYASDEFVGGWLTELLHPDEAPEVHDLLSGDWDPLPDVPVRVRVRAASSAYHQVELAFNDLRDDPRVRGVVVTMRDITEQAVLERLARGAAWMQLRSL